MTFSDTVFRLFGAMLIVAPGLVHSGSFISTGAGGPSCPAGMAAVEDFCIDQYEAPNDPAQLPLVMYDFNQAEAWCTARGKRLCFDDEWTRACAGSGATAYPYGNDHVPGSCNDEETWMLYNQGLINQWPASVSSPAVDSLFELLEAAGSDSPEGEESALHIAALYQGELPGSNAACESPDHVFDTVGNVEEWTRRRDGGTSDFHGNLKGRYWAESRTCQDDIKAHGDVFRFYELGFRCCSDPQTEPGVCSALLPVADGSGKTPGLIISAIDPGESIELFNSTASAIDLGNSTGSLCSPFNYVTLSNLAPGTAIGPGAYARLPWPDFFSDTEAGGQIILYETAVIVPENMTDFVCWGSGNTGRKAEAEAAGHWSGDCVAAITPGKHLRRLPGNDGSDLSAYDSMAEPVSCMTADDLVFFSGFEANQPPTEPTSVVVEPPFPTTETTPECHASGATDPDFNTIGYNYQWFVNGTLVGGNTFDLDSALTSRGNSIRCEAQADDGAGGQSGFVSSPAVEVVNTPPSAPGVNLTPEFPLTSELLICSITAISTDPDFDGTGYTYRWFNNGVMTGNTANTTPPEQTEAGQIFRCEVQAFDGFDAGPWGVSPDRVILADP